MPKTTYLHRAGVPSPTTVPPSRFRRAGREGLAIRQIAMLSIPERPGHRVDGRAAPGLTAPEGSVAQQRGWSTNDRQAEKSRHFPFAFSLSHFSGSPIV